ncbi:MAG: hypothetical protein R2865_02635 [Deinococcales bacterium]
MSVEDSLLHPAVRYRRFYYPHATGECGLCARLNPKGGSFHVIGEASSTHKLSELSQQLLLRLSMPAIFDPDQNAIGF